MSAADSKAVSALTNTLVFDRYASLLETLAQLIRTVDIDIDAFGPDRSQSKFIQMPNDRQEGLVNHLETYRQLIQSAADGGVDIGRGGSQMAWSIIRQLGWIPGADAFSHIERDDVVEIYDAQSIQVFRSFNFFRCASYTLDEIYTYPWWELYDRDMAVSKYMQDAVGKLPQSGEPQTVARPFPRHIVTEKWGPRRITAEVESSVTASLHHSNSKLAGYVHAFRIKSIGRVSS